MVQFKDEGNDTHIWKTRLGNLNKSYTNVGSVKLTETNLNKFFEKTRPKESNAKLVWFARPKVTLHTCV